MHLVEHRCPLTEGNKRGNVEGYHKSTWLNTGVLKTTDFRTRWNVRRANIAHRTFSQCNSQLSLPAVIEQREPYHDGNGADDRMIIYRSGSLSRF